MTTRDEAWLQDMLDRTWDQFFADVPQVNHVRILYGRRAKRRLGSIGLDPVDRSTSVITMNGIFRRSDIPEFVVEATIFHELTHYAHGFNSPLNQAQKHPHAGGVIRREYAERGSLQLYLQQKKWLKTHWPEILQQEFIPKLQKKRKASVSNMSILKPFWFIGE